MTRLAVNFIGNQITFGGTGDGDHARSEGGKRFDVAFMHERCDLQRQSGLSVWAYFPKLSLFLSILPGAVPWFKAHARGAYRPEGNRPWDQPGPRSGGSAQPFPARLCPCHVDNGDMIETAASMKCRGYPLKGRTAFSIYRFDYRDRSLVIAIFSGITLLIMAVLLDQTRILYRPELMAQPDHPAFPCLFYAAYLLLCLLPAFLEIGHRKKKWSVTTGTHSCFIGRARIEGARAEAYGCRPFPVGIKGAGAKRASPGVEPGSEKETRYKRERKGKIKNRARNTNCVPAQPVKEVKKKMSAKNFEIDSNPQKLVASRSVASAFTSEERRRSGTFAEKEEQWSG